MEKIKVGVVGFAQMHIIGMVAGFRKMEEFEFIGISDLPTDLEPVSDETSTRRGIRANLLQQLPGIPVYENYKDLLAQKPDLCLVATENCHHANVVADVLSHGIDAILEKPMCFTNGEAKKMVVASQMHDALFMVNWPTTWQTGMRTLHRLMSEGLVGKPIRFHHSNNESLGPFSYGENMTNEERLHEWWYHRDLGGGAPMDYLGYGAILSRWFLGKKPIGAFAETRNFTSQYADVEDHATMILRYDDCQALIEGTWATFSAGVNLGPIIYGEKGTLVWDRQADKILLFTERHQKTPTAVYDPDPLPEGRETLAKEYLYAKATGDMHPTLSGPMNMEAVASLDAAFRSIASGKMEIVL